VVSDGDGVVRVNRDVDLRAEARERLVHRVVDHLVDQVVQPAPRHRPDVHRRAAPDRFEPLENLDRVGLVAAVPLVFGRGCGFSLSHRSLACEEPAYRLDPSGTASVHRGHDLRRHQLQLVHPGARRHPDEQRAVGGDALGVRHGGDKFDKSTYKVSGGLHGVGVSVVNALSEKLEVWVDRDGKRHHMAFERGDTKKKLEVIGKAKGTGTTVWFKPDTEIFTETRFDYATLANRLRELAFLNKALTITLKDERKGQLKQETFFYKGGLAEFVKYLLGNRKSLHPKPITFETTREGVEVEGAVQYDDGYNDNTFSFVNNINTHEGGTHLTGFRAALTRTINEWAKKDGILKKEGCT